MKLEKYRNKLARKKQTRINNEIKHYKTNRGVYCLELEKDGQIWYYIGSSINIPNRVKEHLRTTIPNKYPDYKFVGWKTIILCKDNDNYPYKLKGFLLWLETKVWLEWWMKHKDHVLNRFPMQFCSNINFSINKKK